MQAFDLYIESDFESAYKIFNSTMNDNQSFLWWSYLNRRDTFSTPLQHKTGIIYQSYYRIRNVNGSKFNAEITYKDMLHIPFNCRHLVSTNRFSSPGMPCTYMSTDEYLAWCECKKPSKFFVAEFVPDYQSDKKLLKLNINPLQAIIGLHCFESEISQTVQSLCITLPLIAFCSVSVNDKSKKFIEEYVIPQMLMAWVKTSSDFIGVQYRSSVQEQYDVKIFVDITLPYLLEQKIQTVIVLN